MDAWFGQSDNDDEECTCSENGDVLPWHDCPYEVALDEDYAELCNCCPACTKVCGMQI